MRPRQGVGWAPTPKQCEPDALTHPQPTRSPYRKFLQHFVHYLTGRNPHHEVAAEPRRRYLESMPLNIYKIGAEPTL